MAKKRKTRKDKARLEQRRRRVHSDTQNDSSDRARPAEFTKSDTPKPVKVDRGNVAAAKRLKAMRYSLIISISLVLAQFIIWWLLRASVLPRDWVELLLG